MSAASIAIKAVAKALPYLPVPYQSLPNAIAYHVMTHPSPGPLSFYRSARDPAHVVMPLFFTTMIGAYVAGVVTGNVSQIDRMWTFLPVLYSAHSALFPLFNDNGAAYRHNLPRLLLMLGLQLLWSGRLSYNTFRRGLFGFFEEDYRWPVWRKLVPGWLFALFHLGFIAIAQSILLLMIALPLHSVLIVPPNELARSSFSAVLPYGLSCSDVVLAGLTLVTLYVQWSADNQQWSFQNYKKALLSSEKRDLTVDKLKANQHSSWNMELGLATIRWTPADAHRGFVTRGLWSWSRHPNFACEQTFWLLQALFPLLGTSPSLITRRGLVLSNPLYGALALSFLFQASTAFTEWITRNKHPIYASYQRLVGEFAPQETVLRGCIARMSGKRQKWAQAVWGS